MSPLALLWAGFWMGLGTAFAFLALWATWHFIYPRVSHKFHSEHFFHKIHEYFTN